MVSNQKEPWMADLKQTNSSGQTPVNRVHFTVGFLVLAMGFYLSAFAVQILFLR
jgi:hypothetical protein